VDKISLQDAITTAIILIAILYESGYHRAMFFCKSCHSRYEFNV